MFYEDVDKVYRQGVLRRCVEKVCCMSRRNGDKTNSCVPGGFTAK